MRPPRSAGDPSWTTCPPPLRAPWPGDCPRPWRLTVAVAAHERRDPATGAHLNTPRDLLNPALTSADAVRDHLVRLLFTTTVRAHPPPDRADPAQVRAWLGTLAAYLNANAAAGRTIDGRTLSGTDLVPHELWPVGGPRRARATHTLLVAATLTLTAAAGALAAVATESRDIAVGTVIGTAAPGVAGLVWSRAGWPQASRADWSRLRTEHGRRNFAKSLAVGFAVALSFGLAFGVVGGFSAGLAAGLAGLAVGLATALKGEVTTAVDPGDAVRRDVKFGFLTGFAAAVVGALAGLTEVTGDPTGGGPTYGVEFWLVGGITEGLVFGFVLGCAFGTAQAAAGMRYLALLMCTRRGPAVLPWSLRSLLAWAEEVGLLRIAGNAYQFRHRELQDWLADPAHQV